MLTNKTFLVLLGVLNFLNIFDAVATSIWIEYFGATELNPLMDWLIGFGYFTFISVKTLSVFLVSFIMWKNRNQNYTNLALYIGLVVYGVLVMYEIGMSILLAISYL